MRTEAVQHESAATRPTCIRPSSDMTKTHWRMPDGPSPLLSDSRETHCVRSAKVILASGTVRQVGMICCRISHWYWCRVLGLRSARASSHASAYSPKVIRPRAGPKARPDKRAANLSERTRHMREYGCNSGISLARVGTRAIEIGTHEAYSRHSVEVQPDNG